MPKNINPLDVASFGYEEDGEEGGEELFEGLAVCGSCGMQFPHSFIKHSAGICMPCYLYKKKQVRAG